MLKWIKKKWPWMLRNKHNEQIALLRFFHEEQVKEVRQEMIDLHNRDMAFARGKVSEAKTAGYGAGLVKQMELKAGKK